MAKRKQKYSRKFLQQLQTGQSDKLIQKVAHTMNHYPYTRDSDVALAIRLLQTFFPDHIDDQGKVFLKDLHKLP
jgi:hypothetical protein